MQRHTLGDLGLAQFGRLVFDFVSEQQEWSARTFGDDTERGPVGPMKHLAKEVLVEMLGLDKAEVEALLSKVDPVQAAEYMEDVEEFADLLILVFDPGWRAGHTVVPMMQAGRAKMEKNRQRQWPTARNGDPNEAVEHDRTKDAPAMTLPPHHQNVRFTKEDLERVTDQLNKEQNKPGKANKVLAKQLPPAKP